MACSFSSISRKSAKSARDDAAFFLVERFDLRLHRQTACAALVKQIGQVPVLRGIRHGDDRCIVIGHHALQIDPRPVPPPISATITF